ncbi:MAG: tryptophan synthase subunit alpha [Brevinematia bacterium]
MKNFGDWFIKTKPTIAYITVGYPTFEKSLEIAKFLVKNNFVQVIEAGIPFSDPIADGEVIQISTQKALENGINLRDVARFVHNLKSEYDVPVFSMGYYNPIFCNISNNLELLSESGCEGVIIPDISIEEVYRIRSLLKKNKLRIVGFVAPNTSQERIDRIVKVTDGFVYLVSSYGTTGVRESLDFQMLKDIVDRIKKVKNIPVAVGFGIRDVETIAKVKEISDGAIVGSAIIKIIEDNPQDYLDRIYSFFKGNL